MPLALAGGILSAANLNGGVCLEPTQNEQANEAQKPARLPYEKPQITWEEVLEVRKTLALSCGHFPGQGGACDAAPGS